MLLLAFVPALILTVIALVLDEQTRKSVPKGVLIITLAIAFLTPTPAWIAFFKWLFTK